MSDYTRSGVAGLCVAAALALVGVGFRTIESALTRDLSAVLFVAAGIAAVASLIAVARGVAGTQADD